MNTNRTAEAQTVTADRIVVGMWIIPPNKKRAVEVIYQLSAPESANYFEFAAVGPQGNSAIRIHRSARVEVMAR